MNNKEAAMEARREDRYYASGTVQDEIVEVTAVPYCDFCNKSAEYDARTIYGPWANLCSHHWRNLTLQKLGVGYGQRIVVSDRSKRQQSS